MRVRAQRARILESLRPAFGLDHSDRIIVDAEQRMTRQALRIASMDANGEDTRVAVLMLRVCGDTLAELKAARRTMMRASPP